MSSLTACTDVQTSSTWRKYRSTLMCLYNVSVLSVNQIWPYAVSSTQSQLSHSSEIPNQTTVVPYQDLVSLGLTDALDVEQLLLGSVGHCFNGVESCILQLFDVTATDSALLCAEASKQRAEAKFIERVFPRSWRVLHTPWLKASLIFDRAVKK